MWSGFKSPFKFNLHRKQNPRCFWCRGSITTLNALLTPYNIRYWWFFLSRGNRWIKYRENSKIWRPKPHQLTFAFLVTWDGFHFHPPLSTQLTANLTLECSDGSMFHPLSYTAWKKCFLLHWNSSKQRSESSTRCCFSSTVSKRGTHFE